MWPFNRRRDRDPLLEDADLAMFAPYVEAERYLLVYPTAVGLNYVLVVVYQSGTGERVHVAHSPGFGVEGGGMENFVEWIATGVRVRDPAAIALLTSWPPDQHRVNNDELMRHHFDAHRAGKDSPGQTILMNTEGEVQNVLRHEQKCLYTNPSFGPRRSCHQWSDILGVEVQQFTKSEWQAAADDVDPDRSIRDAAEQESRHRFAIFDAFLKEQGFE